MTQRFNGASIEAASSLVGSFAHAEGTASKATGNSAHAEGGSTNANATYAHAEGGNTTASGVYSHAEGGGTTSSGQYAHAEGNGSTASGTGAHSEGVSSTSAATSTHAEGSNTNASADYSHAGGYYAKADALGAFARGSFNPANAGGSTRMQSGLYTIGAYTTAQTLTELTTNGAAATTSGAGANVILIPAFTNISWELNLTARTLTVATQSESWLYAGLATRDSAGTSPRMVSYGQVMHFADGTSLASLLSFGIANVAGVYYMRIAVTPVYAAGTVWHGVLRTNEITTAS